LHPPAEGRRTRRAATSVDVGAPEIVAVLSKMSAETSSKNDGIPARSVSLSVLGVYTLLPATGREQFECGFRRFAFEERKRDTSSGRSLLSSRVAEFDPVAPFVR
jgi:hypothetical protein